MAGGCTPTKCRYLSRAQHLLLALGAGGTVRAADRRNAAVLGRPASALVGKPLADLVVAEDRRHLGRILARTESNASVWDTLTFTTADGAAETLLCCFQRIAKAGDGRGTLLVTGLRIDSVQSDLRAEAAAVLGRLAFACHAPVHRLMQALEAVLARHPECEAAKRCRADLDALLGALARSSAWPADPAGDGPVDVIRVVEASLRLIDGDPFFKRLKVLVRPQCPAAWAPIHPAGLACVALHLAANARDATARRREPTLVIDVGADAHRVTVEFTDNGRGIHREDLGSVFAPGFSKGAGTKRRPGVGLSICRQLVTYLGGTIRIRSRPSHGTTVILTFPAADAPA